MVAFRLRMARSRGTSPIPTITSPSAVTVNENAILTHTLTADRPGAWSVIGGADQALYDLTGSSLTLPAQDYEAPADSGGNNTYVIQLRFTATSNGLTADQTFTATVADVDESAAVGGTDYEFAPVLEDREMYRTILVDAGDEVIDFQKEVAAPYSPTATAWSVTGTDAAKLEAASAGRYVFASATRAALAGTEVVVTVQASNSFGTSPAVTLTIKVPADANCRFCDYASGADANNGTTPALAWKHAPGSTPYTGSAVTLTGGKVLFFKGGISHRYGLHKTSSSACLDHVGSVGNPFVYAFEGWGGSAIIDGSDVVTGWTAVTSGEVNANPNWANIEKLDLTAQGGALAYYQHLFCGDVMQYPANTPLPLDVREFEGPDDTSEQHGMWRAANTSSSGTTPRMYQASGTSVPATATIVDPRIAARFGAVSPVGWPCHVWRSGNDIRRGTIQTYDQGTSTITVSFTTSTTLNSVSGMCAYSITHHPFQIEQAGQFALSSDRLTLYAWRTNGDETSVARRGRGLSIGQRSYVISEGGLFQRCAGENAVTPGCAFPHTFSTLSTGIIIRGPKVRQMRADGGEGCGVHASGGANYGFLESIFERFHFEENPKGSGFRLGARFNGLVGGTAAQVSANAGGKIRDNYVTQYGVGRTFGLLTVSDGAHIYRNLDRDRVSVHGNGVSLYDTVSGDVSSYSKNCLVELNYWDNSVRPYTVSVNDTDKAVDRANTIRRNILIGGGDDRVMALYSGEPGSTIEQNILMFSATNGYTGEALTIDIGNRVIVQNNVVAGINDNVAERAAADYDLLDNLLTVNTVPPGNGSTQIVSGNTVATGAPITVWDGTITAEMEATLGTGQIGVFHSVPA